MRNLDYIDLNIFKKGKAKKYFAHQEILVIIHLLMQTNSLQ